MMRPIMEYGCKILLLGCTCIVRKIEKPLKLYCDDNSAVLYSNNNRSSTKLKYIDIKYIVVKERVQSGQVSLEQIRTDLMIVDPLTKGLPPKVFRKHTTYVGICCFSIFRFSRNLYMLCCSIFCFEHIIVYLG